MRSEKEIVAKAKELCEKAISSPWWEEEQATLQTAVKALLWALGEETEI